MVETGSTLEGWASSIAPATALGGTKAAARGSFGSTHSLTQMPDRYAKPGSV
jgi:hypothetical protein